MNFKRQIVISASAAAASALAFTALAEHATNPKTDQPNDTTEHLSQPEADRLNDAAKASDIIGMTVKNYQGEKLGKVEDLAVDVESGRIVQVILSTGGFIGIGDRLSAVPPGALHHDVAQKVLHLDANKEKLTSAPQFEMSKWSECCDSAHLSEVYRHYGQESALRFIHRGDVTLDRARDSRTLTPLDQGNSKADIAITAQIRKEIIADKNMSVNARNVKIITNEGKVTLRGPVNTAEEKRLIGEIAERIARVENVDNQIEVTLATTSSNN